MKKIKLLFLSPLFILLFCGTSNAIEFSNSSSIETQGEMNEKARAEFDKADKKMTDLYNHIMDLVEDEDNKKLIAAQNAWIKYRDLHCEAASFDSKGGSIYYLDKFTCLKEITEQRITALQSGYFYWLNGTSIKKIKK